MVVGIQEELEVGAQLVMVLVVVTLDGRVLEGAVHALDLAVNRHDGHGALKSC